MFRQIAWFEIRFWLRAWMLWIFLLTVTLLICAATLSDEFLAEFNLSNIDRNTSFVIATFYGTISVFTLLLTATFVGSASLRDVSSNAYPMIYATPVKPRDLLQGRFLGATIISLIPMLGVSFGILFAQFLSDADMSRWQAVHMSAHWKSILVFGLPNTFFTAAVLFAASVLWRKEIASFIAAILIFLGRSITGQIFQNSPGHEKIRALLDPFGARALAAVTRYWTVEEKNTLSIPMDGLLLWNRLLWIGIGLAAFALAYSRFTFTQKSAKHTNILEQEEPVVALSAESAPRVSFRHSSWAKFQGSFKVHFHEMARSPAFLVIAVIAAVVCTLALIFGATKFESNETFSIFPVTYALIELVRAILGFFLIAIIIYFSGALVWKDREDRVDLIADAAPIPEWISYASRLAAMMAMLILIQLIAIAACILFQTAHAYHRFQFGLYLYEFLVRDTSRFLFLAVLSFLIQALLPNKYAAYFLFITFYFLNTYLWAPLNIASNLIQFAKRPAVIYSDFFGDAPYRSAWGWFTLYWLLFCIFLGGTTILCWPRGKQDRWQMRYRNVVLRFSRKWKIATVCWLTLFATCGIWIWYNTERVNTVRGPHDFARIQAEYERTYKPFDQLPQPRVKKVKYSIDIFPSQRNGIIRGEEDIINPFSNALNEIHFSLDPHYETSISIPGATIAKDDALLSYRIYRFTSPLKPGEDRTVHFTVKSKNHGFENNVSNVQIVQNGTLLNNLGGLVTGANYLAPIIGYDSWRQLTDSTTRKKYGLTEVDLMPPPERNCTERCRDTYVPGHSDWVDISATISTAPDQIAVAPGSLIRQWQENGRNYFEYQLDHPSMNLYCIASARYQVLREQWSGIDFEIYYLKEHPWNISRMMEAMKKSFEYYVQEFGPYAHKQARIVEFPRTAGYAAAFPGTMMYSESFGFIADLRNPAEIDDVFYVVAHEMAHQWWDEQVIGANVQGATLLSESLSQYSALMVMEKEYGRDMMRKFLRYEMDLYLTARGQERMKERPLLNVEYKQFYVHYNKGSVALYLLKEMIGEDAVNRALRKLIHRYAYANSPYPTSYALVDALREETPPQLQYLIKDLFEDIILFSNRTISALSAKLPDGNYQTTIQVEAQKYKADGNGKEVEVPVNDWIDIGAFAKPSADEKYGATLYRQRVHITQRSSTFTFKTSRLPEKAGIDPFLLLVDRNPDDNTIPVTGIN